MTEEKKTERWFRMKNQLQFLGDKVAIPAHQFWCVVLKPSGAIVSGSTQQDHAEDFKGTVEACCTDYDRLEAIESVEVVRADKILAKRRRLVEKRRDRRLKVS